MLQREIVAVCSEIQTKHINFKCKLVSHITKPTEHPRTNPNVDVTALTNEYLVPRIAL